MNEQVISIETAKILKSKGFNLAVKGSYTEYLVDKIDPEYPDGSGPFSMKKGEIELDTSWYFKNNDNVADYSNDNYIMYAAPTQGLLQQWLREVHRIYVSPRESWSFDDTLEFVCTVNGTFVNHNIVTEPINRFKTYEDALEAGLKLGLTLIK